MLLLTLGVALMATLSQSVPAPSSYELLSGARLTRFRKSMGCSEVGRNIQVRIAGDRLTTKLTRWNRASVFFTDSGVRYVVRRDNPHLLQTLRKLRRPGKTRTVVVKGRVMADPRKKGRKRTCHVWVRTLQAIMVTGKQKKK